MKTAVIYSRISTTLQDAESQNKELIQECKKNNYQLLTEPFTETISGITKADSRKQFNNLKTFVETNKPDYLLVWEISRLGRDTSDVLDTLKYFNQKKICTYLKKENLYTLNEDGSINYHVELLLSIMASIGSVERRTTMERSIRGLRNASLEGHWLGGRNLPYGYKREEGGKMLVVDEEEAEIVRGIYKDYLGGKGSHIITKELNQRNIPTRFNKAYVGREKKLKTKSFDKSAEDFKWATATIYHILSNPLYVGKRVFKKEIFEAPSIISQEDFTRTQLILAGNNKKKDTHTTHFYLLGNVKMKCGECNKNYYAKKAGNNPCINQYVCFSEREKPKCKNNGINIDKLTYSVWYVLKNDKVLKEHIEKSLHERDINKEIENKEFVVKEVENEYIKLDKFENYLLDKIKSGKDVEKFDKALTEAMNDKKGIQINLTKLKDELNEIKSYRDSSSDFNSQIREIKGDRNKMKEVFTNIIKSITFNPVKNRIEGILHGLQDKLICVDLLLHNTPSPITYLITQRSQSIVILNDGEYDYENKIVVVTNKDILSRNKELKRNTNKKYITQ